jgi:hypothetical protein
MAILMHRPRNHGLLLSELAFESPRRYSLIYEIRGVSCFEMLNRAYTTGRKHGDSNPRTCQTGCVSRSRHGAHIHRVVHSGGSSAPRVVAARYAPHLMGRLAQCIPLPPFEVFHSDPERTRSLPVSGDPALYRGCRRRCSERPFGTTQTQIQLKDRIETSSDNKNPHQ